jgi:hypothetical protein
MVALIVGVRVTAVVLVEARVVVIVAQVEEVVLADKETMEVQTTEMVREVEVVKVVRVVLLAEGMRRLHMEEVVYQSVPVLHQELLVVAGVVAEAILVLMEGVQTLLFYSATVVVVEVVVLRVLAPSFAVIRLV